MLVLFLSEHPTIAINMLIEFTSWTKFDHQMTEMLFFLLKPFKKTTDSTRHTSNPISSDKGIYIVEAAKKLFR